MELDGSYDLNLLHLERTVAESYRRGISKIRQLDNPKKILGILGEVFDSLDRSRPLNDAEIDWIVEIVPAYRNLTKIFNYVLKNKILNSNIISQEVFSEYNELFEEYESEPPVNGDEAKKSKLTQALQDLKKLKKIQEVLDNYKISSAYELDNELGRLKRIGELEKKLKQF